MDNTLRDFTTNFLKDALKSVKRWKMWPTHWAGGTDGVKVDGHNTVWVESMYGIICRMETDKGRVTPEIMERAALIAKAPVLDAKVKSVLFLLMRFDNRSEREEALLNLLKQE